MTDSDAHVILIRWALGRAMRARRDPRLFVQCMDAALKLAGDYAQSGGSAALLAHVRTAHAYQDDASVGKAHETADSLYRGMESAA